MFTISEVGYGKMGLTLAAFRTLAEATDYAKSHFPVEYMEIEEGEASFVTKFGAVYSIQSAPETHHKDGGTTGAPLPGWAR